MTEATKTKRIPKDHFFLVHITPPEGANKAYMLSYVKHALKNYKKDFVAVSPIAQLDPNCVYVHETSEDAYDLIKGEKWNKKKQAAELAKKNRLVADKVEKE